MAPTKISVQNTYMVIYALNNQGEKKERERERKKKVIKSGTNLQAKR